MGTCYKIQISWRSIPEVMTKRYKYCLREHCSLDSCCGLSLKPAELAYSFLFSFCVYFCLYGPFDCISFRESPDNSPFSHIVLPVLSLLYWSFELHISLWISLHENLLQAWYNPMWLTGLKTPVNSLTSSTSLVQQHTARKSNEECRTTRLQKAK